MFQLKAAVAAAAVEVATNHRIRPSVRHFSASVDYSVAPNQAVVVARFPLGHFPWSWGAAGGLGGGGGGGGGAKAMSPSPSPACAPASQLSKSIVS